MVKKIKLDAQTRGEKDNKAKELRRGGFIPAVLYSAGIDTRNLKVNSHDFDKVFALAGEASLIDLNVDGREEVKIIIKDIQKDVLQGKVIHIDFYQVDMKKKIEVEIPLNFIGESKAVKELGGTLVKNIDSLEVRCLPGDLIEKIDVDLSGLETFADSVKVKDLIKLSSDFEVLNQPDDLVIHVVEPQAEEEEPVVEEEAEEEALEGEEKKEGEEAEAVVEEGSEQKKEE